MQLIVFNYTNAIAKELQARVKKRSQSMHQRRARQAAKAKDRPAPARIKAYKAAGLDTRGLWLYSQQNRAKALALIESIPDVNQFELFDPRYGNSQI
jgi:hypothetical protein